MGKFGHLVVQALLAFLAVMAVYLGFVTKFMKALATMALGDTSRSYKRAQLDSFNIDRDAQQVLIETFLIELIFRDACRP